jgi:hypothetical protein
VIAPPKNGAPNWTHSTPTLDLFLAVALLGLGLSLRWPYLQAVIFPPLDDPAFYLTTGKNLADGRGLTVDVLWSYQIPFPSVTHPSHEHWMPLTSGLVASTSAFQRVLDQGMSFPFPAGQIPGWILGSLLVPLTYLLGRRTLPSSSMNRVLAAGSALLVALSATLSYQSASADSSAPYALLAACALVLAMRHPRRLRHTLGAGLLLGLAYLTRSDGLLLVVAIAIAWWLLPSSVGWRPDTAQLHSPARWSHRIAASRLANSAFLGLVFAAIVAPWLVRNVLAFGTPLPSSVLNQAWLTDYVDTFNFLAQPAFETWLAQGWPAILTQRAEALAHNSGVFLSLTFPWGLMALPGLWLMARQRIFVLPTLYAGVLFLVTAIAFPVSSISGTFYHSLAAVTPFLAVAASYAVYKGLHFFLRKPLLARTASASVMTGLLILGGFQFLSALPTVSERHRKEAAQFRAAAQWLAQNAYPGDVIMTTQPYTLYYASGHPTIVLPGNEPPDSAWDAAQRYGARYLVITQVFGHYPTILHEQPDSRFRLLSTVEGNEIYEIATD